MEIYLLDNTLFVSVFGEEIDKTVRVNEELDIILNATDELIGFSVNCLSIENIGFLKS